MHWSFVVVELVVFALSAMVVWHAYHQGSRWLSSCLWAMAFGLTIELLLVVFADPEGQHYVYGDFLLMVGPAGEKVPIWVGVGWGSIVYVSTFTAQRLRSPWMLRPLTAGLLAVSIDLSLDPIAERLGFWKWFNVNPLNYFGVPFDNFVGWFLIVSSFALCVRAGLHWIPESVWGRNVWLPGVAAVAAVPPFLLLNYLLTIIYRLPYGELALFSGLFAIVAAVTWGTALRSRRDNPSNWPVLTVPLVMHATMLFLLFTTGTFRHEPALLVVIPLTLVVGFFAFSWPSLDSLFTHRAR